MIAATSMVLLVTASARLLGPQLSGLLSPIPVLAWPLCIFVHAQQHSVATAEANGTGSLAN
jgi:hypothetical protein